MARITQEELDRRIGAAGGSRLVHSSTVGKKKIPNPAHKDNGGSFYTVPEEIEAEVQQWKSPEGHTIQAMQMPDGSWELAQDEPPAPKPATTTTAAAKPVGTTTNIEGTPLPGGGFDNERPVMVTREPGDDILMTQTITLFRPVGPKELALIQESGFRAFAPRLREQPIFYPVLNESYATQIARDWNSKSEQNGNAGFVTRFEVRASFLAGYQVEQVGGRQHQEYWIPAEELPTFNENIVGEIAVIAEYRHGERVDAEEEGTAR